MNRKIRFSLFILAFLCSACVSGFVVNSNGDESDANVGDGKCETAKHECTLRAAIEESNANQDPNLIEFDDLANSINVHQMLPPLYTSNITIRGKGNTIIWGDDCESCWAGLQITSSYNVIQGLMILAFDGQGIYVGGNPENDIAYNVIGQTPNQVPQPGWGNVIGYNSLSGISIGGSNVHHTTVAGNYIGTSPNGSGQDWGNGGGIFIGAAHDNLIGGTAAASTNYSGLVAYWTLDEDSGSRADSVGANTLTDNNTVSSANGKQDKAADFERNNSEYLEIGDTVDLSTGDINFTIAGWINPESVGQRTVLSKEGSAANREYSLTVGPNGLRFLVFNAAGASIGLVDSSVALMPGNWYFFVAYHDAINDEIGLSINNGPFVTTATTGIPADTSAPFRMGAKGSPAGSFYDGLIDEVGFWKRLLTSQEIDSMYNNGSGASFGYANLRRNVISGNDDFGIMLINGATANHITGNYIGVTGDEGPMQPLGNDTIGIMINSASGNLIGITPEGEGIGNVISGNGQAGVSLDNQSFNNIIAGNLIGTDNSGTQAMGNSGPGIWIAGPAGGNIIGTNGDGAFDELEGNLISGNGADGILIDAASGATNNEISGNLIGADLSGTGALGNAQAGLHIESADGNLIGGSPTKANLIAYNGGDGVFLSGLGNPVNYTKSTPILFNSIFSNDKLGINLIPLLGLPVEVNPNDPADADDGANQLMNYPELTAAVANNGMIAISGGMVDGLPNASFEIQFFDNVQCDPSGYGEGENYIGETMVTTDGSGNASFTVNFNQAVPAGHFVAATATHNNNTSEFSLCVEVAQTLSLETTGEAPAVGFTIVPLRNLNCRYFCTTQSDIADTLLEGVAYVPLGWDAGQGYLAFEGPTYGELCWAAPQAGGTPLMGLTFNGAEFPVDQLGPDEIASRACPAFSTPTPTIDVDEGENATPTPKATAVPECSDGKDNDGDGAVDLRDPQCRNADDNDEANP